MVKKESEMPQLEIPSITKIITCEKCGTKTKVEIELDIAPLIPLAVAGTLPPEISNKDNNDKD